MFIQKAMGGAAVVGITAFLSIGGSQAAMAPAISHGAPSIHHVDCAVGLHLGPLGTCVVGVDNAPPPPRDDRRVVVEHHDADGGCETKSVNRTDSDGNSETKTKTNCPQ